jgi:hypothetical protein
MNQRTIQNACPGFQRPARSRREFLATASNGFGMMALGAMLADNFALADGRGPAASTLKSHHAAKAKHVVFCFMDGGPSHVDSFDYKPALKQHEGKAIGSEAVSKLSQSSAGRVWLGSPWDFQQRGESGLWVSDLFPQIAGQADQLCVARSLVGTQPLHGQQALLLHTGRVTGSAPSLGSWVSYGLGSENANLPDYVLLNNDWIPNGGYENFASAYLPASHGATLLRAKGDPVDNIRPTDQLAIQQRKLQLIREQDQQFAESDPGGVAIEGAIRNYETAFRMQSAIPHVASISEEPEHIQKLYGLDSKNDHKKYYSMQCLRARRLIESGVRFVEITCPLTHSNNSPWDQHGNLKKYHDENSMITDQAVAALITDLRQRGMAFGQTDDFGNTVVENPLTIHDIHATILHQLGLDHERLTFRFGGRDVSLTDVHGRVVTELLS